MYKKNIITKSNHLIEAKYKLTLEEQRLILYLVSQIHPSDGDFKEYIITVKDFSKLFGIDIDNQYKQFRKIANGLTTKNIIIHDENGGTLVSSWLTYAYYLNGVIKLVFSPPLKPYLLQLKRNFTSYKLENIVNLSSIYSIRIYELLKQYQKLEVRELFLGELKDKLNILGKYNNFYDFKKKILWVSQKELKEKTDIYFDFEEIKTGKKITKIRFFIHNNENVKIEKVIIDTTNGTIIEAPEIDDELIQNTKKIINETISKNSIIAILASAKNDLDLIKKRYSFAKEKKQIKNIVGFLIWACSVSDKDIDTIKMESSKFFEGIESRNWDFEKVLKLEQEKLMSEKE